MGCLKLTYYQSPFLGKSGKEKDEETGFYYFGARYQDPRTSIFLSIDPMAEARPGINPYAYCSNNPLNRTDPTGMLDDDYRIFGDGNIEVTKTDDNFDRFYLATDGFNDNQYSETLVGQFNKNENGLIQLPSSFSFSNSDFGTSFGFNVKPGNESNSYIRGDTFAALIGAMASTNTEDITIIGFSKADGSSPKPSVSHKNGINGDLRYLNTDRSGGATLLGDKGFDSGRQNKLNEALYKFGWKNMLSENYKPFGGTGTSLLDRTSHYSKSRHHNHLHMQGFKPNLIVK